MVSISLVIPVYNTSKYLKECLNSILAQTFTDFEAICVDDGSTDNSIQIIEEYQKNDNRIKLLKSGHKGVGNARNTGLYAAQGEYIQFLDSDDFFEPNMLEEMYHAAIKEKLDIVICSAKYVDEESLPLTNINENWPINTDLIPINKSFHWKECPENIIEAIVPEPWLALYNREFFIKNDLKFTEISSSNGACLGYAAKFLAKRMIVLNKEFINYRYLRNNSITSNKILLTGTNMIKQRHELRDFLIKNNLFKILKNSWEKELSKRIRYTLCKLKTSKECDEFCTNLKVFLGTDYNEYEPIIKKYNIMPQCLYKLIGEKKVFLWGASLFLRRILEKATVKNPNIIGVIDKNPELNGCKIGAYTVYPPEILNEIKPDSVILTVVNHEFTVKRSVKEYLEKHHPDLEFIPSVFQLLP